MPVKAVIFDMDGVILDSMRYHVRAWQKTFKPFNLDISDHEIYAREGESWLKSTYDFLKMAGIKPNRPLAEKVFQERGRIFKEIFRPKIFPGAKALLAMLSRKGFILALVTATPKKDVKRMLPASMRNLFTVMVCGGDTMKGKPYPDPYLSALEKIGINSSEAIVVENAPYGIASAKMAGIKCIAVKTSLERKYLRGADIIKDSLYEVAKYFMVH